MQKTGHRGLCNLRDILVPSDPSAVRGVLVIVP